MSVTTVKELIPGFKALIDGQLNAQLKELPHYCGTGVNHKTTGKKHKFAKGIIITQEALLDYDLKYMHNACISLVESFIRALKELKCRFVVRDIRAYVEEDELTYNMKIHTHVVFYKYRGRPPKSITK